MTVTRKKLIAVCLASFMTIAAFGGCTNKEKEVAQQGGEMKEISMYTTITGEAAVVYSTLNENPFFQELEKRTGVHVNFIHQPPGSGTEHFNLMIASGDYPEVIEASWFSVYAGGPQKAIEDGLIIPLNDIMEEHAPNFTAALKSNAEWDRQSKTDDGSYYGFTGLNCGPYRSFSGLVLRKDWLDELGLEVPQTIDEVEAVLKAFKEKKGAEAPYTASKSLGFANSFGTSYSFYLDGDKIKFGPIEDSFKDYLQTMNKWYKAGLIDRDYVYNSSSAVDEKFLNGTSGAIICAIGTGIGKYMTSKPSEEYDLVAVPHIVLEKGEKIKILTMGGEVNDPTAAITSNCKNPEAAAEWLDYLYSEEGSILKVFGIEGDTFNFDENGNPIYTDKIVNNPDGLSVSEAFARFTRSNNPSYGFQNVDGYHDQYYTNQNQKDALKIWNKDVELALAARLPKLTPLPDESEEFASLSVDVNTYIEEEVLKFIQGDRPISEYDDFVKQIKKNGVDRILKIYQDAYDRYLKR